jgi:hypothetical protein
MKKLTILESQLNINSTPESHATMLTTRALQPRGAPRRKPLQHRIRLALQPLALRTVDGGLVKLPSSNSGNNINNIHNINNINNINKDNINIPTIITIITITNNNGDRDRDRDRDKDVDINSGSGGSNKCPRNPQWPTHSVSWVRLRVGIQQENTNVYPFSAPTVVFFLLYLPRVFSVSPFFILLLIESS